MYRKNSSKYKQILFFVSCMIHFIVLSSSNSKYVLLSNEHEIEFSKNSILAQVFVSSGYPLKKQKVDSPSRVYHDSWYNSENICHFGLEPKRIVTQNSLFEQVLKGCNYVAPLVFDAEEEYDFSGIFLTPTDSIDQKQSHNVSPSKINQNAKLCHRYRINRKAK